jgi:hypothetical protein
MFLEQACAGLALLCSDPAYHSLVRDAFGVEALVRAVSEAPAQLSAGHAAAALGHLTYGSPQNQV